MQGTDKITILNGIGDKTAKLFQKLNINTIHDLAGFYPRCYLTYEEPDMIEDLQIGVRTSFRGMINSYVTVKQVRHMKIITCTVKDITGSVRLIWYNMPFLKKVLHIGEAYIFVGTPVYKNGQITLEHPEYYTETAYQDLMSTLQPVYPLTDGLTNKLIQKAIRQALPYIEEVPDYMPAHIKEKFHLRNLNDALMEIHFPQNKEQLILAKRRIIFDEFFLFLVAMRLMKEHTSHAENYYRIPVCEEYEELIKGLSYTLTNAQKRAMTEIQNDFLGDRVMNRLVQGDVGSGKTILAVLALLMTAKAGYQGALMVPTEVLAKQHYETFTELLSPFGIKIELLTGSVRAAAKRDIYERLKRHEIDIIIGTHALIQEKVEYDSLALVVTDEQHRFGVRQRESLSGKGFNPHVLVMSATPIPRTLAIIMYGDLDISIVDELPANRLPIKNCVVDTSYRPTAYRFLEKEVTSGHQVYVICPMVAESETIEAENVIAYTDKLRENLPAFVRVEYLNGKMKPAEKNEIMERFSQHEMDVLVSTTVIEVGINVPNATVMMVENAERFGLAQLHQLRGRVGRGDSQSYCIFISGNRSKETKERLGILNKSNDGFFIANEDLRLRGPGDFFGVRQSGMMDFAIADIYDNADMLRIANEAVEQLSKEGFSFSELKSPKLEKQLEWGLHI